MWVPVPDINSMSQCSTAGGDCNLQLEDGVLKCKTHNDNEEIVGKLYAIDAQENFGTVNTKYNEYNGMKEPVYLTDSKSADESDYNKIGLTLSEMQENYKNMASSVAKYNGFYVGRYETSLSNATTTDAKDGNAQSKQGVIPTSAANSVTLMWYGLYKIQNKTYTGKNNSVESSMIWGSQYDRILNWVMEGNDREKITNKTLGNNLNADITITGDNKYSKDIINNIRDLGGNLWEWTLEGCNTNYRTFRGGAHDFDNSPSYRSNGYGPANTHSNYGSRMTLYIK